MAILSVDLASRRYQDIGIAVIDYVGGSVRALFVKPRHALLNAPPSAQILAAFLSGIAEDKRLGPGASLAMFTLFASG
jgi:hypothetical protein